MFISTHEETESTSTMSFVVTSGSVLVAHLSSVNGYPSFNDSEHLECLFYIGGYKRNIQTNTFSTHLSFHTFYSNLHHETARLPVPRL